MNIDDLRNRLAAEGSLVISVRACKSGEIQVSENGILKIPIQAPREKGKANQELVRTLSKLFGLPQSQIQIIRGQTTSQKLIKITC